VDQSPVVGGHPLLRDAQYRPEHANQEAQDLGSV
jgi:hypothetical protein